MAITNSQRFNSSIPAPANAKGLISCKFATAYLLFLSKNDEDFDRPFSIDNVKYGCCSITKTLDFCVHISDMYTNFPFRKDNKYGNKNLAGILPALQEFYDKECSPEALKQKASLRVVAGQKESSDAIQKEQVDPISYVQTEDAGMSPAIQSPSYEPIEEPTPEPEPTPAPTGKQPKTKNPAVTTQAKKASE